MPVSLSPSSLIKLLAIRLGGKAAKSLVIPPAVERDAVSLREFMLIACAGKC